MKNVTSMLNRTKGNFFSKAFHNDSNYDSQLFIKKWFDRTKDKIDLIVIPRTSEDHISVSYGCSRFIDNYRFLSSSLDE